MNKILAAPKRATLADLARVDGKAELIGGRIIPLMPTGDWPGLIGGEIYASLRLYAKQTKRGKAYPDGVGFAIDMLPSGRESFSPDASYFTGRSKRKNMRFVHGAPVFAAEVRGASDYGAAAETELAAKRADYFAAGTQVVWDVDPRAETVTAFHAADPLKPIVFGRGDVANAGKALPGWGIAVDDLFDA